MLRALLTATAVITISASLAVAETELPFAPKYTPGQIIENETVVEADQTLSIAGMNLESGSNSFIVTEDTVTEVTDRGATLQGKMKSFTSEINAPGGVKISFDSGNPDASEQTGPLGEVIKLYKIIANSSWTTKLSPEGEVVNMTYSDDVTNNLPEAFKGEFNADRVKKDAAQLRKRLPDGPVKVGDSWKRNEEVALGQGQTFYIEKEYTYAGSESHNGTPMEKITSKTLTLKYDVAGSGLPLQVKSSDLKVDESDGTIWYDPSTKTIAEVAESFHISGDLVLIAQGMELPSELDLTMKFSTKISRK